MRALASTRSLGILKVGAVSIPITCSGVEGGLGRCRSGALAWGAPDAFGGPTRLTQRRAGELVPAEPQPEALQWRRGAQQRASVYQPCLAAEAVRRHSGGVQGGGSAIANSRRWVSKAALQPGPSEGAPQTSSMHTPLELATNAEPATGHTPGSPRKTCLLTGPPHSTSALGRRASGSRRGSYEMQTPGLARGLPTRGCGTPAWDLAFRQAPGWVSVHARVRNHRPTPRSWAAPGPQCEPLPLGALGGGWASAPGRRGTLSGPSTWRRGCRPPACCCRAPGKSLLLFPGDEGDARGEAAARDHAPWAPRELVAEAGPRKFEMLVRPPRPRPRAEVSLGRGFVWERIGGVHGAAFPRLALGC